MTNPFLFYNVGVILSCALDACTWISVNTMLMWLGCLYTGKHSDVLVTIFKKLSLFDFYLFWKFKKLSSLRLCLTVVFLFILAKIFKASMVIVNSNSLTGLIYSTTTNMFNGDAELSRLVDTTFTISRNMPEKFVKNISQIK